MKIFLGLTLLVAATLAFPVAEDVKDKLPAVPLVTADYSHVSKSEEHKADLQQDSHEAVHHHRDESSESSSSEESIESVEKPLAQAIKIEEKLPLVAPVEESKKEEKELKPEEVKPLEEAKPVEIEAPKAEVPVLKSLPIESAPVADAVDIVEASKASVGIAEETAPLPIAALNTETIVEALPSAPVVAAEPVKAEAPLAVANLNAEASELAPVAVKPEETKVEAPVAPIIEEAKAELKTTVLPTTATEEKVAEIVTPQVKSILAEPIAETKAELLAEVKPVESAEPLPEAVEIKKLETIVDAIVPAVAEVSEKKAKAEEAPAVASIETPAPVAEIKASEAIKVEETKIEEPVVPVAAPIALESKPEGKEIKEALVATPALIEPVAIATTEIKIEEPSKSAEVVEKLPIQAEVTPEAPKADELKPEAPKADELKPEAPAALLPTAEVLPSSV